MAAKKVFMLRLNPEIYEAMEKWAADEFRSVNGQIEWLLDAQLKKNKRSLSGKKSYPASFEPDKTESWH